ncbi:ECF transporter S component [Methanococcus maripaludis]|uniref:LytS/YehU family sensor histidine kinase n=2 Tax=Methanococcus maripaludis TaxID=39152 RepID=A0A7J9PHW4_METMI|nr:ECF transporter S component [Methanococcus maripaludis]MBA2862701.1 LytS/YehU family sensor histidine kinase [Methanococcus maripaludis]
MSTKLPYLITAFGISVNVLGGFIATFYELPIFLNNLGTILCGLLLGPAGGAITGLFSNLIIGSTVNSIYIPFTIVNVVVGFVAGYAAIKHNREFTSMIVHAFLISIIALCLAMPIEIFIFGGPLDQTLISYASTITANTGLNMFTATYFAEFPLMVADIVLSAIWAYAILMLLPTKVLTMLKINNENI